jgi:hypothetical protein
MEMRPIDTDALRVDAAVPRLRPDFPVMLVAAVAAIVGIAIQTLWVPIDADVSWLITVSERILSGDRLYVDILEVNPPASVWLYLPLVWLAKLLVAKPEAVVSAAFVAAGLASVFATLRFAERLDDAPRRLWLVAALSFVALVLPMALFAQREHAALLLALPALAALATIGAGRAPGKWALCAAGAAAALIIVIKPFFLLAVIAPALWAAWKRRSLVPLFPGIAAAMATIAIYAAAVLLFAADYFRWVPVIAQTYAPMHNVAWKVIAGPTIFPAICLALALLLRPPRIPSLSAVWALGAAGFIVAAVIQAKNYPNHWLPGCGLALAAAFVMLAQPGTAMFRRAAVGSALALVAVAAMYMWTIVPDPAVAAAIRRVAPPNPKIIALSPQLVTGHPVTRNVGGHWAGSRAGLFTAAGARFVGRSNKAAAEAYREDIGSFAADVRINSPDVVLVERSSKKWLMREPVIAQTMRRYRLAATAGGDEIWVRRGATG